MSTMKLHWSPRSPYVRKVMMTAHELGLIDRIEIVRSAAAMTQPNATLMVDNPLSKIPTLVMEDGTSLFDSIVICEYLNDLAGGALFPREGAAKWQALRWHALADGLIDVLILWRNERDRPAPWPAMMEAFEHKTRAALARLDEECAALATAPFSIAHVTVSCALGYLDYRFPSLGWRALAPRLAAWHAPMAERKSYLETVARDG